MLSSILAASTSPVFPGLDALSSVAVLPVVVWALISGAVAAWFAHRYAVGEDEEGYEIAVLADATCPRCDHVVTLSEAVPGRRLVCGSCSGRLPLTWVGTHAAVLIGCLAMLATFGDRWVLLPFLWLVPVLVAAAITDLRTMLIPRRVVWVGFSVGLAAISAVAVGTGNADTLTSAFIGSAAYFGFLFVCHIVFPAGMGFGDVRLALLLGLYLGWIDLRLTLFGLLIGNLVYLAYALPQRVTKGKEAGRFAPFGPGLAMGTLVAVVFYSSLIG